MIRAMIFSVLFATAAQAQQNSTTNAPAATPAPVASAPAATPPMDAKRLERFANKLVYQIDPAVFTTKEFPPGAFQQDAMVRSALGPVQVDTTYYNDKFEEVKEADAPGRYGAVVQITLGNGTKLTRFNSLYRIPDGAPSQTINLGRIKVPVETGTGPDVAPRQLDEMGIAMRAGTSNESGSAGFAMLFALSKALPGMTPDQLLGNFMGFMARDDAWWFELKKKIGLQPSYLYFAQTPDGYDADTTKHWPLILFLHGSGSIGSTIDQLKVTGVPHGLLGRKLPVIFVAPTCPDQGWSVPELAALLDEVSTKYRVDPDHIIVTGASMGGFGTWALAEAYPDRFSAIVPVCGGGSPTDAAKLSKVPVWAFHGMLDPTVPVLMSQMMVSAIQTAGGTPHLTIYPETKHNAWDQAYATDALYTWMLAQQRGKPEMKTPGVQEP